MFGRGPGCCSLLIGGCLFLGIGLDAVLGVVPREIPDATGTVQHEDVVHKLVHEIAVVAHKEQAPREVQEELLQHAKGKNVEVVGGLVKHQEIRVAHQDAEEVQPFAFATTELVDEVVVSVTRKQKPFEELGSR